MKIKPSGRAANKGGARAFARFMVCQEWAQEIPGPLSPGARMRRERRAPWPRFAIAMRASIVNRQP